MNHDLITGNPGTTFSNILERDEYDPTRHAVVLLSTFREMLHKWIIDVYLQTPHRGINDTPAHRWHTRKPCRHHCRRVPANLTLCWEWPAVLSSTRHQLEG